MASGWWRSSIGNLAEVSPDDFEDESGSLPTPRGYPKLASIATGAGHFLGGTPCITVDGQIYFASDNYTQDTDNPPLYRFNGTTTVLLTTIPPVDATPAKAILSLAADHDTGNIYISTWDSGTTSSDFAGRVFVYNASSLTQIDQDLFTGGKLPYALCFFNGSIYVGVSQQDPAETTEVVKLSGTARSGGPNPTPVLTGTTYTYQVGGLNNPAPSIGAYIGRSAHVSVINRTSMSATNPRNELSWNNSIGALSWRVEREAGTGGLGVIADISPATTTTLNDTGQTVNGAVAPDDSLTQNINLTVTTVPAEATCSYVVVAVVDGIQFVSEEISVTGRATLHSDLYIALSWASVPGATNYKVYRTAGHTSTGLIATVESTTLNDTGLAGNGSSVPAISTSISLPSGAVGALTQYANVLYVSSYQPAGTFGKVFAIDLNDDFTTSDTIAPGGTAQAYNGFTAGVVFQQSLYVAYWNDDATDICTIRKFDGDTWSNALELTGGDARPIVAFYAHSDKLFAYGGGDGKTGIFYSTIDGATWTDYTALLPDTREAVPFMGVVNIQTE